MTITEQTTICAYSGLPSVISYQAKPSKTRRKKRAFEDIEIDRIIQMAWEDRTPFEAIEIQFGLKENEVVEFMRQYSLPSSFKMWRKRMNARKTKHAALRDNDVKRFKCSRQRGTGNKIAKR